MGPERIQWLIPRPFRRGMKLLETDEPVQTEPPLHPPETIAKIQADSAETQRRIDVGEFDTSPGVGKEELVERVFKRLGYYPSWVPDEYKT